MATMDSHSHGDMCSMSMLWNTSTRGMCIVFSSWRVSGPTSFYLSLATLFLLAALSEYLRYQIRMLDIRLITSNHLTSSLLCGGTSNYHRRKASVQHVHSTSSADLASSRNSPAKTSSLGGPSLATSALGVGLGDRRSPGFASADSSNVGSRSDDDAPLLPGGFHARPKKKHLKISERLMYVWKRSFHKQLTRSTVHPFPSLTTPNSAARFCL